MAAAAEWAWPVNLSRYNRARRTRRGANPTLATPASGWGASTPLKAAFGDIGSSPASSLRLPVHPARGRQPARPRGVALHVQLTLRT
jgi:hypothetical protein